MRRLIASLLVLPPRLLVTLQRLKRETKTNTKTKSKIETKLKTKTKLASRGTPNPSNSER